MNKFLSSLIAIGLALFVAKTSQAVPVETLTFEMTFQGYDYLNRQYVGDSFKDTIQISFPFIQATDSDWCFYGPTELCLGNATRNSGSTLHSNVAGGLWEARYHDMLTELNVGAVTPYDSMNTTMAAVRKYESYAPTPYATQFFNYIGERETSPTDGGQVFIDKRTWLTSYAYSDTGTVGAPALEDLNAHLLSINDNTFLGDSPWRLDFEVRADLLLPNQSWGPLLYLVDYVGFGKLTKIELDGTTIFDGTGSQVPEPESLALFAVAFAGLGLTRRKAKQAVSGSHTK